jgi:ornithine carbamoyltransferase
LYPPQRRHPAQALASRATISEEKGGIFMSAPFWALSF